MDRQRPESQTVPAAALGHLALRAAGVGLLVAAAVLVALITAAMVELPEMREAMAAKA